MSSFASSSTIFARDEVENATVEALLRTGNVCCETWLFKKGGGSTLLGRRAWRRRYFVLISSRDASEPSALFWFDGPPAFLPDEHIDADEVLEGIPKPKGAILLDDPACARAPSPPPPTSPPATRPPRTRPKPAATASA